MALKVAIVGLAESSHKLAPWGDPEWELWGLACDADCYRLHRTFEMHDIALLDKKPRDYFERLRNCAGLYMQAHYSKIANSQRYPFEDVAATVGNYFCSSIAYAMALAIHEGAEEIGLWGVNMEASDEYGYQRPNMEYLIGFARGRGIKVFIPDTSPLCKFVTPKNITYSGRYGHIA